MKSKIHFVGIGGSSMSGLACLALHAGYEVVGSDRVNSHALDELRELGVKVYIGQSADNITDDISLVVYTVGVSPDNPELVAAAKLSIPTVERSRYLGMICERYRYTVAVTGTHGKTSTTAMIGSIMLSAGIDPGIHLGGIFPLIGGGVRPTDGDYFVTEACEYHAHMLELHPYAAVILNVEAEHLDYYKDLTDIKKAFAQFVSQCSPNGFVVVCAENSDAVDVCANAPCRVITYAVNDDETQSQANNTELNIAQIKAEQLTADYIAHDICEADGHTSFNWSVNGECKGSVRLNVLGRHNILNAMASIAVCDSLGCSADAIREGLDKFTGTARRFELVGTARGASLYDDYAHHPTEIGATLAAARHAVAKDNKIYAIFQAHTYSRAHAFCDRFAAVLKYADEVIVADIYAAREADPGDISGASMAERFRELGVSALYLGDFNNIADYVYGKISQGDMVISLGAGDVNKVLSLISEKDSDRA